MARSDLLLSLVRSSTSGDRGGIVRTVEAMVAEERAKQHNVLADRLEKALKPMNANGGAYAGRPAAEIGHKGRDFVVEIEPRRTLNDVILPDVARLAVGQLIEEQQRASILRSFSLEPRHSVLLVGPPGNGKTSLAEAIAEALALPFFVVRYELMIGSYLGETAARLKRVFDYARTTPCVLFFDEFDAIGKERGDTHETGEIKRVVTSLLMQVDELPSYTIIVAATNHAELLDRAVWRRFELSLSLPAPFERQIAEYLEILSRRAGTDLGLRPQQVARALGKISYGEAEQFYLEVVRRQVLALSERAPSEIANEQLKIWAARAQMPVRDKVKRRAATSASKAAQQRKHRS